MRSARWVDRRGGAVYVAGGHDGTAPLNTVERFDVGRGVWEAVAPMGMSRMGCAAAALDALSGVSGDPAGTLDAVESLLAAPT